MYYRSSLSYHLPYLRRRQATLPPSVVAALLWVTVSVSLCFGYYGNQHMVLGPNSSRMLALSSVFVRKVQVRDASNAGLLLYGFPAAPEPSLESNWTVSKRLFVESYSRKGFSLRLNTGSVIKIRWGVIHGRGNSDNLKVVLFKGEGNLELLQQYSSCSSTRVGFNCSGSISGEGQGEYRIEQDGSYLVGAANMNSLAVTVSVVVELSSTAYDVTAATSVCSTSSSGSCKMELRFPRTLYVVLATPAGDEPSNVWYVEISFVARLMAYFGLVGFLAVIVWIFLKYLYSCSEEGAAAEADQLTVPPGSPAETDPIMAARKETPPCTYGSMEEDSESGSCRSEEDLYDGNVCVICYEERRSCFFVPCGHCATCHACAQRIMEEDNKVCPICRRQIHKVRKLLCP